MEGNWSPGEKVEILTSRYVLSSLSEADVGEECPTWYGDDERREHIWSPDMPATKFLRGLSQAVDNENYFALLARPREGGDPIGLIKGQVMVEGAKPIYVVTTLLGQRSKEGWMSGYEMTSGAIWFALLHLGVREISLRIYEGNETALAMVQHSGYELRQTYEERSPKGLRRVFDYRKARDSWLAKNAEKFSHYVVRRCAE